MVLLSHLDCDRANGLKLVSDAKQILVSEDELRFARNHTPVNLIRYNPRWWRGTKIRPFEWNGTDGPAGRSYDIFGDGSLVMINIPGHSKGLCALKITNPDGRFVLLYSDGGYASRSWEELILRHRRRQVRTAQVAGMDTRAELGRKLHRVHRKP